MPNYLQLNIPEGCSESWNDMLPNHQGRHCLNCQKTVVDFTAMTDTELVNFFKKNTGNTCGRFTGDQLQRDILIPKKQVNWVKYLFQFAIPAFLLSIKTSAKTTSGLFANTELLPFRDTVPKGTVLGKMVAQEFEVSGKIIGERGEPVSFASVFIKGSKRGVAATDSGTFKLNHINSSCTLVIAAVGYESKEIAYKDIKHDMQIVLKLSQAPMGEIAINGFVVTSRRKRKKQAVVQADTIVSCSAKIYPNPISSSGILNINWTNAEAGKYSIQITNLQGQVVQVEKLEMGKKQITSSITLKDILAGNYAVIITNTKTGNHFSNQLIVQ